MFVGRGIWIVVSSVAVVVVKETWTTGVLSVLLCGVISTGGGGTVLRGQTSW